MWTFFLSFFAHNYYIIKKNQSKTMREKNKEHASFLIQIIWTHSCKRTLAPLVNVSYFSLDVDRYKAD